MASIGTRRRFLLLHASISSARRKIFRLVADLDRKLDMTEAANPIITMSRPINIAAMFPLSFAGRCTQPSGPDVARDAAPGGRSASEVEGSRGN